MPQKEEPKDEAGILPCLTAFGENFLGNLIDPLNTAEGIVGIASGLAGAGIDAGLSGRAPPGGTVSMGGRKLRLARVGVGRSAIRTAGAAARGFAIGYVVVSGGVAAYQASQDKRCQ